MRVDAGELLPKVPIAALIICRIDAAFARRELSASDLEYSGDGIHKITSNVGSHEIRLVDPTIKKFERTRQPFPDFA